MTGGSSGGPWYIDFNSTNGTGSLNSLNSFKYTSGKFTKFMFGPYFGDYTLRTYNAAKSAPNGTVLVS
jgi:hypothetical protein